MPRIFPLKPWKLLQENAQNNNVNVNFVRDLLTCHIQQSFDIITANLPLHIPEEFRELDKSVKDFEPTSALVAEDDGLSLYRQLTPQAYELISRGGHLFF